LQITATHQLQTAVTSLALVSRAIILASAKEEATGHSNMLDTESATSLKDTLVMAMFSTLMGLDANDPPKTLATMQFYCSVLSSVSPCFFTIKCLVLILVHCLVTVMHQIVI
jgi:proteasome activator subunit 4